MILTFIDDSDDVGKTAMAKVKGTLIGGFGASRRPRAAQSVSSTKEMVVKALMRSAGQKISALRIMDHGVFYESGVVNIGIGKDEISLTNFHNHTNDLALLKGRFHTWGFVHFFNCGAGQNQFLLLRFAQCLDVPVYATIGYYAPAEDKSDGSWVAAFPDGTFQQGVKRPSAWKAMLNSQKP